MNDFAPKLLQTQVVFGVILTILSALGMVVILLRIEKSRVLHAIADGEDLHNHNTGSNHTHNHDNNNNDADDDVSMASDYRASMDDNPHDLELRVQTSDDDHESIKLDKDKDDDDDDDNRSRVSRVSKAAKKVAKKAVNVVKAGSRLSRRREIDFWITILIPTSITAVLTLLVYLLLVFLPSGLGLSLTGLGLVTIVMLRSYIHEELRRSRLDRLMAIVTLLLVIASMLSLITYARLTLGEGYIYRGRARIVGHDETKYNNGDVQGEVTRTDMEVAWGGSWGCPYDESKQCQAMVSGALCEVKSEDDDGGNRRRKMQASNQTTTANYEDKSGSDTSNQQHDSQNQNIDDDQVIGEGNQDNGYDQSQGYQDDQSTDVYDEMEQLAQEEYDEAENQSSYYDDYYGAYSWDDEYWDDAYWDYDWDSIWGDSVCDEALSVDLDQLEYDATFPPGQDNWPFVYIYGSCNTCDAYLMDYYSTEHFQQIQNYQLQGYHYGIAAFLSLLVTAMFVVKQHYAPAPENEVVLLSSEGGGVAA